MSPFTDAEFLSRIKRTREHMRKRGIEVLITCDPANMNYLTGYDGWSFYVPQAVVLPVDEGAPPLWIGRRQDARAANVTTFLAPEQVLGYSDDYVQAVHKHPFDFVADVLVEFGWGARVLGVEMDGYYFSAKCYDSLVRKLPDARFQDAYVLVNWVRAIKSDAEIGYMRQAARIVERAMETAFQVIEPGVRQCDAVAEIYRTQIAGTEEFGGDYTSIVPLLPTGQGTSTPHLTWSDAPFVSGEATMLELAGCRRRYHCPMARTIFLGTPPQRLIDAARYVGEGLQAALDAIRSGVLCQDVELAWREAIAKSGLVKDSRIGYSCGLNYPPDWGEHTMSLRPGDHTPLEPNMTLHVIPGIWMSDWGIEMSEAVRVTETGHETLCSYPRELYVKQ